MCDDYGLHVTGLREGWEIRMFRGGKLIDVIALIEEEEINIRKGDKVIIMGGSNDIGLEDEEEIWRWKRKTKEKARRVINKLMEEEARVIMVKAPPRRDASIK